MDEYWGYVQEWWPTIHRAYTNLKDKRPVILVVIDEARVYAYPPEEFKKELSTRSQDLLDGQCREAQKKNQIVVFVRDDTRRKLVSYSCRVHSTGEHPAARPNKGAPPDRGQGAARKTSAGRRRGRGG